MRRNTEYLLIGVIVGSALGFVVGLLFAPESGAKTRRRLADEAMRAAEAARAIAERAEQAAEVISGRVGHYLGKDEETAWRKVNEIREGIRGYTQTQTP
ncbi:MAG TPA: YtxH domain-containing protein [Coriobacteriia bacterium]|nr:YtxH domain-containing protein [Coriobacteriia bacterium]